MESYRLSLHSHTTNFAHFILTKPNKIEYLESLLKILFRKKGNLVLGISNFNDDNRYQKLLETAKKLKKYEVDSHSENFFSIKRKEKKVYFIKTDEIETDKGHILIIGFKGKIKERKLENVLREAHKQKCIIIANHPLHPEIMISYFLVRKILNLNGEASMNRKELKKHKKDFDAIELNSYFPEDWKKIKEFAKKNNVSLVSDSDAHFLDEIFTSFYDVKNLNFENLALFKKSLKQALKKNIHLHAKRYGYFARYKHILEVILENFGRKIGLIKV